MTTIAMEGQGGTITFGTSGFAADLITLTLPEFSKESFGTTHQGTVGAETFKACKLYTVGDISAEFDYDPSETNLVAEGASETITIALPLLPGQTTPHTFAFPGHVSSFGGQTMDRGDRMKLSVTIKPEGAVTETPATTGS